MRELAKRKTIRLKNYDYSQNGYYFITICTKERQPIFWESAPTKSIMTVIGQMKRWVSKKIGSSVWQKSYFEHIIRDENDYIKTVEYILNNPIKTAVEVRDYE